MNKRTRKETGLYDIIINFGCVQDLVFLWKLIRSIQNCQILIQ